MKAQLFYIIFSISIFSNASHIVGGEFALTRISGNQYKISFFLFQDALNANAGAFDFIAQVTIFEKNTNLPIQFLDLPLIQTDTLPSEDGVCDFVKFRTSRLTYSTTFFLTDPKYQSADGFYVAWDRCCRNAGTNNILNSDFVGTLIYAEFPPISVPNSSPLFSVPIKTVYGCVGIPQSFSFAATDPDGDDLVYSLEIPLNGSNSQSTPSGYPRSAPYQNVPLNPFFSLSNLVPGFPAANVNSATGILSFVPTLTGFYALRVKVKEFRNGTYLGEVNREYQLVISSCFAQNTQPGLLILNPESGKFVTTLSSNITFNAQQPFCLTLAGVDPKKFQTLSMKSLSLNFGDRVTLKSLTPERYVVKSTTDTAFFQYCIPACTYNSDSLYNIFISLKNENNCSFPSFAGINLTLKNIAPKVAQPKIQTSIPNNATFYVGDTLKMVVTVTSQNGNWLRLTSNTFSPIPLVSGSGKNQIITQTSYVITCNDLTRSQMFYTIRALDSNCVNQLRGFNSLAFNIRKKESFPDLKVWDSISSSYVSTLPALSFDKQKSFCLSFAGIDTVLGQNISLTASPVNFSSLLGSTIFPFTKTVVSSTDTAKFNFCFAPCIPNTTDKYDINFKIKSQSTCISGTSTELNVSLINTTKSNTSFLVYDEINNDYASTLPSVNFDGRKDFCLSFLGTNMLENQTLNFSAQAQNFSSTNVISLSSNSYTTKSKTDTAYFSVCLKKCIPNANTLYNLQLELSNSNACLNSNYNGKINLSLNNTALNVKKPLIETSLGTNKDLIFYIKNEINFNFTAKSLDSNWVILKGISNFSPFNSYSKGFLENSGAVNNQVFQCNDKSNSPLKYTIVATDSNCFAKKSDTLTYTITILDSLFNTKIFIPNVITPNNDGTNDFFEIKNLPNESCNEKFEKIEIYNRWGTLIHSHKERDIKWDAQNSPDGVYFYVITYTNETQKGWIQVLR